MAGERFNQIAQDLGDFLVVRLIKELVDQGHAATGELIRSIETEVVDILGSIQIVERHIFYGNFVERGRKARIRRVPIDAIEAWLIKRRFEWAITNTRGAAFAVQTNIFKFGIKPSRFITKTLREARPVIAREVTRAANAEMEVLINNLVTRSNKLLNVPA